MFIIPYSILSIFIKKYTQMIHHTLFNSYLFLFIFIFYNILFFPLITKSIFYPFLNKLYSYSISSLLYTTYSYPYFFSYFLYIIIFIPFISLLFTYSYYLSHSVYDSNYAYLSSTSLFKNIPSSSNSFTPIKLFFNFFK
jgi:hypothetical protein